MTANYSQPISPPQLCGLVGSDLFSSPAGFCFFLSFWESSASAHFESDICLQGKRGWLALYLECFSQGTTRTHPHQALGTTETAISNQWLKCEVLLQ